jgi:hypothetical protein
MSEEYNPEDFFDFNDSMDDDADLNDDIEDKKEKSKKEKYHKDKFWMQFEPDLTPEKAKEWINYLQATLGSRFKDGSGEPTPPFILGTAPLSPWHGDHEFQNMAAFYELEARKNIDRLNSEKKDNTKRKERKLDFINWIHDFLESEKDEILSEREKNLLKWNKENNR